MPRRRCAMAVIGLDMESFLDDGRTDFDPAALEGNRGIGAGTRSCACGSTFRAKRFRRASRASDRRTIRRLPAAAPADAADTRAWRIPDEALQAVGRPARRDLGRGVRQFLCAVAAALSAGRSGFALGRRPAARGGDGVVPRAAALCAEPRHRAPDVHFARSTRATSSGTSAWAGGRCSRPGSAHWSMRSTRNRRPARGGRRSRYGISAASIRSRPKPCRRSATTTTRMRWYRDTSHYSPESGDMILDADPRRAGARGIAVARRPPRPRRTIDDRSCPRSGLAAVRYRRAEPDESRGHRRNARLPAARREDDRRRRCTRASSPPASLGRALVAFAGGVLFERYVGTDAVHRLGRTAAQAGSCTRSRSDRGPHAGDACRRRRRAARWSRSCSANRMPATAARRAGPPHPGVFEFYRGQIYEARDPLLGATGDGGSIWLRLAGEGDRERRLRSRWCSCRSRSGPADVARFAPGGSLNDGLLAMIAGARERGLCVHPSAVGTGRGGCDCADVRGRLSGEVRRDAGVDPTPGRRRADLRRARDALRESPPVGRDRQCPERRSWTPAPAFSPDRISTRSALPIATTGATSRREGLERAAELWLGALRPPRIEGTALNAGRSAAATRRAWRAGDPRGHDFCVPTSGHGTVGVPIRRQQGETSWTSAGR